MDKGGQCFLDSKSLDQASILRGLKTDWFGRSMVIIDECGSTNDVLARMAGEGAPHGAVVIAETQRAGRGRFGRAWCSPRGGVWMSVLLKRHGLLASPDSLPIIAALGTAKTMVLKWRVRAAVRWPNDVVVDGRKIAGILVESRSKGNELTYSALGIGINANIDTSKLQSISASSTSLLTLLGTPVNREELIAAVLSDLEAMYESIQATGENAALDLLEDLDWSRGKQVRVRTVNRDLLGSFESYESLGRARIRTKSGLERVETNTVVSVDYESD